MWEKRYFFVCNVYPNVGRRCFFVFSAYPNVGETLLSCLQRLSQCGKTLFFCFQCLSQCGRNVTFLSAAFIPVWEDVVFLFAVIPPTGGNAATCRLTLYVCLCACVHRILRHSSKELRRVSCAPPWAGAQEAHRSAFALCPWGQG